MEGEHQQTKNERFPNRRNQKHLVLVSFPDFRVLPRYDGLRNNGRVDQGKSNGPILDAVLLQQQHVIDCQRAEEESQVQEKLKLFAELILDLLLAVRMCRIHHFLQRRQASDRSRQDHFVFKGVDGSQQPSTGLLVHYEGTAAGNCHLLQALEKSYRLFRALEPQVEHQPQLGPFLVRGFSCVVPVLVVRIEPDMFAERKNTPGKHRRRAPFPVLARVPELRAGIRRQVVPLDLPWSFHIDAVTVVKNLPFDHSRSARFLSEMKSLPPAGTFTTK